MNEPSIRVRNLTKSFGGRRVVDGLSFDVEKGQVFALLGHNGAGKSTTIDLILGLKAPEIGTAKILGMDAARNRKQVFERVGVQLQHTQYQSAITVEEACIEYASLYAAPADFRQLLESFGLNELRKSFVSKLSGGERQKLSVVLALIGKPEIVLLDEPFSALDSYLRDRLLTEVKDLLGGLKQEMMLVTHSRDEAYTMCGKLLVMDHGKICDQGNTKEVFADPHSIPAAVLTGCKNIYAARAAGETAVEITDLGVIMETGRPVRQDLCAIGIRAHYFNPKAKTNLFPVMLTEEVESPFEWTLKFRYLNQKEGTPDVWWRVTKDKKLQSFPQELGIAPANLLLLYPYE